MSLRGNVGKRNAVSAILVSRKKGVEISARVENINRDALSFSFYLFIWIFFKIKGRKGTLEIGGRYLTVG